MLFVRHGESEANLDNVLVSYQGNPALTIEGLRQAELVASWWRKEEITAIYSSPLQRAQDTAQAFVKGHGELSVNLDPRLHEIGLGRWDGRRIPDIEQEEGERYRLWKQDPELGAPGGGEALSSVGKRLTDFLSDMRRRYPNGFVVAATHADCLKALVLQTLHAPWSSSQWLHLTNVAGVYMQWRDGHWQMLAHPITTLSSGLP